MPSLPPSIANELAACAADLRVDQYGVPVLLRAICNRLRITVRRDGRVPNGKAYLAWDRHIQAVPTILLPLEPHDRWDRFCAAHELAHYFLISRYDWIPMGSNEYWQTEDICDQFARDLLLPQERVCGWLAGAESLTAYLSKCDEIAKTAIVPWKEVATSISAAAPVAFFRIVESERKGGYRVSSSSLPKRDGNGSELDAGSEVVGTLRSAMDAAKLSAMPQNIILNSVAFKGTKMATMLRKRSISQLVARVLPTSTQIKVAGLCEVA